MTVIDAAVLTPALPSHAQRTRPLRNVLFMWRARQDSNPDHEKPLASQACSYHDCTWCSSLVEQPRDTQAMCLSINVAATPEAPR